METPLSTKRSMRIEDHPGSPYMSSRVGEKLRGYRARSPTAKGNLSDEDSLDLENEAERSYIGSPEDAGEECSEQSEDYTDESENEVEGHDFIEEIIDTYSIPSPEDDWNLITLDPPRSKLQVPKDDIHFWNLYAGMLESDERLNVGEKIPKESSIFFEVRLFGNGSREDEFSLGLESFVSLTKSCLETCLKVIPSLTYAVSASGIHHRIQFPFVRVKMEDQKSIIYPALTSALQEAGYNPQSIIEYGALKEPLPLLGSSRVGDCDPWTLVGIYSENGETIDPVDVIISEGLQDVPSIPYLLSLDFGSTVIEVNDEVDLGIKREVLHDVNLPVDHIGVAMSLLPLISAGRFHVEREFKEIGQALYTASNGGSRGLSLWKNATIKSRANPNLCDELYPDFFLTQFTIKTLAWYAKKDDPEGYSEWHAEWLRPALEMATSHLDTDVGYTLYRIFWLEFVCAGASGNLWYSFEGHGWVPVNHGVMMKTAISQRAVIYFNNARKACLVRARDKEAGEDEKKEFNAAAGRYAILIDKLKTQKYKGPIYRECIEHFYDGNFAKKLNSNPNLFGLMNGVIEIDGNQAIFRPGKPDDYLTKYAPIAYNPDLTWENPLVVKIMRWMKQLFMVDRLIDHFLKVCSSYLRGRNSDKIFMVWLGVLGNNSKTTLVKLFETWGPYCIKFTSRILTGGHSGSGPDPELARAAGARIAFIDEPEGNKDIQASQFKRAVGGDSYYARLCHDNGGEIQNFFKLVLVANSVPFIPNNDKAVRNRLKIIPFSSTWEHDAPPDEEEQFRQRRFPVDITFESQLPKLAPAFLWILVQYFPRYVEEGLVDPPEVSEAISSYWDQHDVYSIFFSDHYEDVPEDVEYSVSVREIVTEFKSWFSLNHKTSGPPDPTVVMNEMERVIGRKPEGRLWKGIRRKVRYAVFK